MKYLYIATIAAILIASTIAAVRLYGASQFTAGDLSCRANQAIHAQTVAKNDRVRFEKVKADVEKMSIADVDDALSALGIMRQPEDR